MSIIRKVHRYETPDGALHMTASAAWYHLARKSLTKALDGEGKPSTMALMTDEGRRNAICAAAQYIDLWLGALEIEARGTPK